MENTDALYEFDWSIRQVEGHLMFGPISRHFPFWIVSIILFASFFIWKRTELSDIFILAMLVYSHLFVLRKKTLRQQALFGWWITKISLGAAAFIMLLMGLIFFFFKNQKDNLCIIVLGFLFLPVWEFIPKLSRYQKYITGVRILAIPITVFILI